MTFRQILSPKQKALEINVNDKIYGSFAEIGAGQEVVRTFFRAGGAAGTVAMSVSAYDMVMSDAIYGRSEDGRYVTESRLKKMLYHEFEQLLERLADKRHEDSCFFAFADTVVAKGYRARSSACHGWLGVRFQHKPGVMSSEIILHVKMFDNQSIAQQESLGTLGTNLIHAVFNYLDDHEKFIAALMDNLTSDSIEIDMIKVKGPGFKGIDSRILSFELVKQNFTRVLIFDENGQMMQPSDVLYKKYVLVLRGSFRPPTKVNFDMLESGVRKFKKFLGSEDPDEYMKKLVILPEISMHNLRAGGEIDNEDFLARVDLLNALGRRVMITNMNNLYCLNEYLTKCSNLDICFVLGVTAINEILDEESYESTECGILGGLGAMFGKKTRIYAYPAIDEKAKKVISLKDVKVNKKIEHLKEFLIKNKYIMDIDQHDKKITNLNIWSKKVLEMIQNGEEGWEEYVPHMVAVTVKERNLFRKNPKPVKERDEKEKEKSSPKKVTGPLTKV